MDYEKELDALRDKANSEIEDELLFDPIILLECQITYYTKEEGVLLDILKKLEDEKNVHVKDFKRQFEEDRYLLANTVRNMERRTLITNSRHGQRLGTTSC